MNADQIFKILIKSDPFEILDAEVLKALSEKVEVREYPPNAYVFKQDAPSLDALFIIASGLVELTVTNDRGTEAVIGLKRPYDFFGETVVLSQHRYPGSARVKEALACCLVHRRDLEKLMYTYPEFCGFLNTLLTERMRLLYEELTAEQSYQSYTGISSGIEASRFRKRVSEVMVHPPITCRTGDRVTEAAGIMAEKDVNAIVALDRVKRPRGILMEKSLVKHLIAGQMYPVETCRVENIMFSNLMEISPQAFIGQALVAMMRSKTEHLIVMERGELVGTLSMIDLIKTQSTGTLLLAKDIESQPDLRGLTLIAREIRDILVAMVGENARVDEIFDVMSELRERITRRVIQLSEEKMKLEGGGAPPVEYCWINMGGGARYEQAFVTDQENAIVYADPGADRAAADRYFRRLAETIVEGLVRCGFPRSSRSMMATDDEWRRPVGEWGSLVRDWGDSEASGDARTCLALTDARPVWGNMSLAEYLQEELSEAFSAYFGGNGTESEEDPDYRLPISFLGTFLTESRGIHKNEMNLNKSAVLPLVNGVRILAARHRISEPSTLGRLKQLSEMGVISAGESDRFRASFESLMMFHVAENMKKVKQGKAPDHYIDPYSLRKRERMALKEALAGVSDLLDLVTAQGGAVLLRYII